MHYGIKGMKWKKKKKKIPFPGDYDSEEMWFKPYQEGMSDEELKEWKKRNRRSRKLIKTYNKKKKKERKTTEKWAKKYGLDRPRRKNTDHIDTDILGYPVKKRKGIFGITMNEYVTKPPTTNKKGIHKRGPYRRPGDHPFAKPGPVGLDYSNRRKK